MRCGNLCSTAIVLEELSCYGTPSNSALLMQAPRLPPLSKDPNRCERAFDGNTIGQANGVADKVGENARMTVQQNIGLITR